MSENSSNIIDSLVILLGIDSKDGETGVDKLKDAIEDLILTAELFGEATKELEENFKSRFSGMAKEARTFAKALRTPQVAQEQSEGTVATPKGTKAVNETVNRETTERTVKQLSPVQQELKDKREAQARIRLELQERRNRLAQEAVQRREEKSKQPKPAKVKVEKPVTPEQQALDQQVFTNKQTRADYDAQRLKIQQANLERREEQRKQREAEKARKAESASIKQISKFDIAKDLLGSFAPALFVMKELASVASGFLSSMLNSADATAQQGRELKNVSKYIEMSTPELQKWRFMMTDAGYQADSIQESLQSLYQNSTTRLPSHFSNPLAFLGVNAFQDDAKTIVKPVDELMMEIADRVKKMGLLSKEQKQALADLGLNQETILFVTSHGKDQIKDLLSSVQGKHLINTDDDVQSLAKLGTAFNNVSEEWKNLKIAMMGGVGSQLAEDLTVIIHALAELAKFIGPILGFMYKFKQIPLNMMGMGALTEGVGFLKDMATPKDSKAVTDKDGKQTVPNPTMGPLLNNDQTYPVPKTVQPQGTQTPPTPQVFNDNKKVEIRIDGAKDPAATAREVSQVLQNNSGRMFSVFSPGWGAASVG